MKKISKEDQPNIYKSKKHFFKYSTIGKTLKISFLNALNFAFLVFILEFIDGLLAKKLINKPVVASYSFYSLSKAGMRYPFLFI